MNETLNDNPEPNAAEDVWKDVAEVEFAGDAVSEEPETRPDDSSETEPSGNILESAIETPETPETPESEEYQKPVGELSRQEAAEEYCDLLYHLSEGFESAEGKTSRNAFSADENGEIAVRHSSGAYSGDRERVVAKLWEARTGEKYTYMHEYPRGEEGPDGIEHYEDPYLDREWSMELADKIIHAESDWRKAGEDTTIEDEETLHAAGERDRKKLEDFEGGALGGIRKTLMPRRHERLTEAALESASTPAERATFDADLRLQKALEEAYSPDYGYGHHRLSPEHSQDPEYQERANEEYNDKFFSPENKATIDRAIELRRRLEADGEL
jgi:hypothetical protein